MSVGDNEVGPLGTDLLIRGFEAGRVPADALVRVVGEPLEAARPLRMVLPQLLRAPTTTAMPDPVPPGAWFLRRNGDQSGPHPEAAVLEWAVAGMLDAEVRRRGEDPWIPVSMTEPFAGAIRSRLAGAPSQAPPVAAPVWFVRRRGEVVGPVPEEQVIDWVRKGMAGAEVSSTGAGGEWTDVMLIPRFEASAPRDSDLVGLVILALVGLGVAAVARRFAIACLVALAVTVYADARAKGVRKLLSPAHTSGFTNLSPLGWGVGTALMAILVVPLYLFGARSRGPQTGSVITLLGVLAISAVWGLSILVALVARPEPHPNITPARVDPPRLPAPGPREASTSTARPAGDCPAAIRKVIASIDCDDSNDCTVAALLPIARSGAGCVGMCGALNLKYGSGAFEWQRACETTCSQGCGRQP